MKPNSCACYGSNDIHECYCNKQNNMKPKDEIEKLANEWSDDYEQGSNRYIAKRSYIAGYTQCEEDMVNNFLSLIYEFKEKELPNRNVPYHYESEIASGLKYFEIFIKEKQTTI